MEKRMNELEFDEFEKLLGEVPSATSGNSNTEESNLYGGLSSLERTRPVYVNFSNKTVNEKLLLSNGCLDQGKVGNVKRVVAQPEEENLPLTSAFAELSFKDGRGIQGHSISPPNSVKGGSFLLNGQFPNVLKNYPSAMDPRLIASNGFDRFDANVVQELEKQQQQIGYCHQTDNFSASVPLAHVVQTGFPLLPNVPVPGVEFPIIPNQQQFYLEAQSGLPYLHPQQLSQPQITRRRVVEEQYYYRMHQQYLHLQQLRNQQLEAQHPNNTITTNANAAKVDIMHHQVSAASTSNSAIKYDTTMEDHNTGVINLNSDQVE